MLNRILVPLDGSEEAERVLELLPWLLREPGSGALLLRAVDCPWLSEPHRERILGRASELALEYLAAVSRRLEERNLSSRVRVVHGDPAKVILETAREDASTLVLMATRGRSGLTRFLVGSVAEKTLRHSDVPVLAVRGGSPPSTPFRTLLVPLDGSPRSETVLPMAETLSPQARIRLLYVQEPVVEDNWSASLIIERPDDKAALQRLESIAGRLRREGRDADLAVRSGDPADQILAAADESAADCICIATHGRGGIGRWLLGSVAERVLRHAAVPTLLARRPS